MEPKAKTAHDIRKKGKEAKLKAKCTYCPSGHSILWYEKMPVLCPYCHAKLSPGDTSCRDPSFSYVTW
jgi:hypothetical protein